MTPFLIYSSRSLYVYLKHHSESKVHKPTVASTRARILPVCLKFPQGKMSSDILNGKKKSKKSANIVGNSSSNEIISTSLTTSKSQNSRIGPRVFKCVILGDGGVGKSGKTKKLFHLPASSHAKDTVDDVFQSPDSGDNFPLVPPFDS